MRQITLRSKAIRIAQVTLVAAAILAPGSAALAQYAYGPYDPYGYAGHPYGAVTRYTVPAEQMHWFSRSPVDFNT